MFVKDESTTANKRRSPGPAGEITIFSHNTKDQSAPSIGAEFVDEGGLGASSYG
jgi:hypothetical protein